MGRRIGAVCRLCRSEGQKLFLKGARCISDKCAMGKRDFTPGMHGVAVSRKRKMSNYALQLREKQKVKRIYGLLERQFKGYFKKADRSKGVTGEVLLQLLERRLDNVIYRSCFASSRPDARQIVRHRFVKVNGRKVDIPSYTVKIGDTIQLAGKDERKKSLLEIYKSQADRGVPEWIEVAPDAFTITVKKMPTKKDTGMPIEESLIVELYSK